LEALKHTLFVVTGFHLSAMNSVFLWRKRKEILIIRLKMFFFSLQAMQQGFVMQEDKFRSAV
jgi:hypothetical protein